MDIRNYLINSKKRTTDSSNEEEKFSNPSDKKLKTSGFEVYDILNVDFTLFTSIREFELCFDDIANKLLNECAVEINHRIHRFEEIEFYCHSGIHQDPFAHCDPIQQSCGKWYFHKTGNNYRGGSYKGVDLTFGAENKGFGGILIRAVEDLNDQKLIEGPSLTVDHILSICNSSSIADFVKSNGIDAIKSENLFVRFDSTLPKRTVFKTPRVGLSLKKKDEEQAKYVMKSYRYLTLPKKTKKGKIQLVLSLYHQQGNNASEIAKITGSGIKTIQSYIDAFEQGKKKKVMDFANQSLDNESICCLYGAWCNEFGEEETQSSKS